MNKVFNLGLLITAVVSLLVMIAAASSLLFGIGFGVRVSGDMAARDFSLVEATIILVFAVVIATVSWATLLRRSCSK